MQHTHLWHVRLIGLKLKVCDGFINSFRISFVVDWLKKNLKRIRYEFIIMPKLITYCFLFASVVISSQEEIVKHTIKKCCPPGQYLDDNMSCARIPGSLDKRLKFKYETNDTVGIKNENETHVFADGIFPKLQLNLTDNTNIEKLYPWFPFSSVINSSTLEPISNSDRLVQIFNESVFEFGPPDCEIDDMDTACFRKKSVSQFLLILHPNNDLQLYVAKRSSYHDDNFFRVETKSCSGRTTKKPTINKVPFLYEAEDLRLEPEFDLENLRTFPLEDVCFDSGLKGIFTVVYCPCKKMACVRKCCPDQQLYDDTTESCVENKVLPRWRPTLENNSLGRNYYLMTGTYPSTCDKPHLLKIPLSAVNSTDDCFSPDHILKRNSYNFLPDGSLQIIKYNFPILPGSYCGEHTVHDGDVFVEDNLFICIDPKDIRPIKFDIYGVIMLIGGVVLLITVAISLYLPELRTSVYYRIIICHNFSLMIANFTWGTTNLLPSMPYSACVFLCLLIQLTFLGSFFWMNIMCIDISLAFRRVRASVGSTVSNSRRFIWYSLYAWGVPVIITSITAAMELAPNVPSVKIRPGFGCHNCGFNPETSAILIYFYGPMIAVLLLNLILFILTIVRIVQIQSETAILNSKGGIKKSSAFNSDKQRLVLFSKLFLLMGLTWSMEIVSWAVGGPSYYWYLPDAINFLRAFFIFVIFICKRTVLCSLLIKLGLEDWAEAFSSRRISAASSRLSETSVGRNRRSRNSTNDRNVIPTAEIERRGRILEKQITQTIRDSDESQL